LVSACRASGRLSHGGALGRQPERLAADEHAGDLAGAGVDLAELGVARPAVGRMVVGVAVAGTLEDYD
jgi:hypothetical protein